MTQSLRWSGRGANLIPNSQDVRFFQTPSCSIESTMGKPVPRSRFQKRNVCTRRFELLVLLNFVRRWAHSGKSLSPLLRFGPA